MTLAGKYGTGVISIGSLSTAGLASLPTQWSFAEEAAAKHGQKVDRANWRVLSSWHIAETREEAARQAGAGLMHWHNEYTVGTLRRPGAPVFKSPEEAVELTAHAPGAAAVIGTPDDLVASIRDLLKTSGGFGAVIGFAHDWANREDTARSWELVARYVIPEVNGMLDSYRSSNQYVKDHAEFLERAGQAVMNKIMSNERAAAALKEGMAATALSSPNAPDLNKASAAE
jgi:limonene 1,2-monooxygenase